MQNLRHGDDGGEAANGRPHNMRAEGKVVWLPIGIGCKSGVTGVMALGFGNVTDDGWDGVKDNSRAIL